MKNFGQRMVADHTEVENQLKTAAAKDKIALPASLSAQYQATYNRLSRLSGDQFYKAYAQDMVADFHDLSPRDFHDHSPIPGF